MYERNTKNLPEIPYLGIKEKAVAVAPTELVHLDVRKLFQDFNLIMENGEWKHFEFQSTNEGMEGLKRFRMYEAHTSYQYKVPVTTYVLFSGNIKNPMTEFTEGVNTYRIVPIIMKDKSADSVFAEINRKLLEDENVTRKELVPLTLCLLMSGEMSLKKRVMSAFEIIRRVETVDASDIQKIESVVYLMADKFLDTEDMEEIMEVVGMTKLGQMILDKGSNDKAVEIAKNLLGLLDVNLIAERTGLPLETVKSLQEEVSEPNNNR